MNKPILSIIILSYNTKQITLDCLHSIFKETEIKKLSFEVIVVDNASTDGSVEAIKGVQNSNPTINLIENKENIGFGKANNQAVKAAHGTYILLLNSDIVVLDHAIEKLFTFYQKNEEKVHFLGGKLLNKDLTPQTSAAPFYTLPVAFAALLLKGDYWGATRSSPSTFTKTGWISGACILTKKEYYLRLDGFDEEIFMYMDEVDLLYRGKKLGYSTYFYPEATFIHLGSASSAKRTYPILQVYRGFLYFYKKHYSRSSLFLLKCMLKLKAAIGITIGKVTHNTYLVTTYEQAKKLVDMDR